MSIEPQAVLGAGQRSCGFLHLSKKLTLDKMNNKPKVFFARAMDLMKFPEIHTQFEKVEKTLANLGFEQTNKFNNSFVPITLNTENSDLKNHATKIVKFCHDQIAKSDYVLADLSIPNHFYFGAIAEIIQAKQLGKKVIAYTGDSSNDKRIFLHHYADHVCKTLEEAMNIIIGIEKQAQSDCFFCDIVDGKPDAHGIVCEVLLETKNHIVIPEAHNMVDETAYTLTISKQHVKSMQDLTPEQIAEQRRIENLLRHKIHSLTGKKVVTFEHGADGAKSVDHAHVHNVGNDGFSPEIEQEIFDETKTKVIGETYLYYRDANGIVHQLPLSNDAPSQYMRVKLWKQSGGIGDFYKNCNWRKATPEMARRFLKNEQFTIDALKGTITDKDKSQFGL
jgi:diadenosine tetraphosphate (Ap4A) HIT family hydrolase